jgi:hypothetical protein
LQISDSLHGSFQCEKIDFYCIKYTLHCYQSVNPLYNALVL